MNESQASSNRAVTSWPFRSGISEIHGVQVDRVLRASTRHMPNLDQDLGPWHWGEQGDMGMTWIYAYQEDPGCEESMPDWLLQLCITARDTYGCNWVLLDPDGDIIDGLPVYEN